MSEYLSKRETRAFLCKKNGKERWIKAPVTIRDTLFRNISNDPY